MLNYKFLDFINNFYNYFIIYANYTKYIYIWKFFIIKYFKNMSLNFIKVLILFFYFYKCYEIDCYND